MGDFDSRNNKKEISRKIKAPPGLKMSCHCSLAQKEAGCAPFSWQKPQTRVNNSPAFSSVPKMHCVVNSVAKWRLKTCTEIHRNVNIARISYQLCYWASQLFAQQNTPVCYLYPKCCQECSNEVRRNEEALVMNISSACHITNISIYLSQRKIKIVSYDASYSKCQVLSRHFMTDYLHLVQNPTVTISCLSWQQNEFLFNENAFLIGHFLP